MKKELQMIFAVVGVVLVVGCAGSDSNSFGTTSTGTTSTGTTSGGDGSTGGTPATMVSLWATTSVADGPNFRQKDRLARPVVNEVFATVANDRHKINDENAPTDDSGSLMNDIDSFLTMPAGRSDATKSVIKSVLVPDVMKFNLGSMEQAAYLGVETNGATGGRFGGRKLTDDVVDVSLGIVFGNTISALGLAPDDGKEIPSLTSDHVDASGKHFTNTFPYLGRPN